MKRLIASIALAVGLIGAPASMMLVNATHAAAEVAPPDCFDDPNGPGCSGGGGGGGEGGATGGGTSGGGGPVYRTAINNDDVAFMSSDQIGVAYLDYEWRSYGDWLAAVRAYWNVNASAPVCTFAPHGKCGSMLLFDTDPDKIINTLSIFLFP